MNADSDNSSQMVTIPPQLSRKLVQTFAPDGTNSKRVPAETASAVSELLRRFIVEARSRASIEAECDKEGELDSGKDTNKDPDDNKSWTPIRAEHITKIAANLLMDYS